MPMLLIAGALVLVVGAALLVHWIGYLWILIKALLPLGLIGAGGLAAWLGWLQRREDQRPIIDFSSLDEACRYKADARAYQDEIKDLRAPKEPGGDGGQDRNRDAG